MSVQGIWLFGCLYLALWELIGWVLIHETVHKSKGVKDSLFCCQARMTVAWEYRLGLQIPCSEVLHIFEVFIVTEQEKL